MPFWYAGFFLSILLGVSMITLHHFNSAYQHYVQHKITFRLLQDQAALLLGLCESQYVSVRNSHEITQSDIDWLLQQLEATQSYDYLLGGAVYICETEQDLLQILGCDFEWAEEHDSQWPNVTDIPMTWDACNYVDEAPGDPNWVMFLICWNNAGGPVYFVPKHLWVQARVVEHIQATN